MTWESTIVLSLILGSFCIQLTFVRCESVPESENVDVVESEDRNTESETDVETLDFIATAFSNILESQMKNKDTLGIFSHPEGEFVMRLASDIADSLVLEVGLEDSYAARGLIIRTLLSVNPEAGPEEYCSALAGILGKILLKNKILNSENYFTLANVVKKIILNSASGLQIDNKIVRKDGIGVNADLDTALDVAVKNDQGMNTEVRPDIRFNNDFDKALNIGLDTDVEGNILGSGVNTPNLDLSTSIFAPKANFNPNTDVGVDANVDIPLGTDLNSGNDGGINIDLSVSEEANLIFKSGLMKELLRDRNFKSVFSDHIPKIVRKQIAAAVCLYISKAFAVSRSFLLPLENSIGNLSFDSTPSPEEYANVVSETLTNLLGKVNFITKGTASLQATIAANAITSGIASFIRLSTVPGIGFSVNENSFNSYFSILNGLQKLPYIGVEAASSNLPPALKFTYATTYATQFAKTLLNNLLSSRKFLELFSLGVPRFNSIITVKSLGNFMAEAFGSPNPKLFCDLYSKALLTSNYRYAVNSNSMNYARALSFATTRALFLNGYFLSGNINIQAAIAKNAIIQALSTKLKPVSKQVVLFPNVLGLSWVTQLKGISPSQFLLNYGKDVGLNVGVGTGVALGLDQSLNSMNLNSAVGARPNINNGLDITRGVNTGLGTENGLNSGVGLDGNIGAGVGLGGNIGAGVGLGGNIGSGVGLGGNIGAGVGLGGNIGAGIGLGSNSGLGTAVGVKTGSGVGLNTGAGLGTRYGSNFVLGLGKGSNAVFGAGLGTGVSANAGLGLGSNRVSGAGLGLDVDLGNGLGANAGLRAVQGLNTGLGAGVDVNSGLRTNAGLGSRLGVNSALGANVGVDAGLRSRLGVNSALGADVGVNAGLRSRLGVNSALGADLGVDAGLRGGLNANAGFGVGLAANSVFGAGANAGLGAGVGANAGLETLVGSNSGLKSGLDVRAGLGTKLDANGDLRAGLGTNSDLVANAGLRTGLDANSNLGGQQLQLQSINTEVETASRQRRDVESGSKTGFDSGAEEGRGFSRKKRSTDDSLSYLVGLESGIGARTRAALRGGNNAGLINVPEAGVKSNIGGNLGTRVGVGFGAGLGAGIGVASGANSGIGAGVGLGAGIGFPTGANLGLQSTAKEDSSNIQLSILNVLPLILANKLYQSTALYTTVSMVGDRQVVNLISQAMATEFSLPVAALFLRSYNQYINNSADSGFEINMAGLAKSTTDALATTGFLNSKFSVLIANQLADAIVAKFSSLITTSLEVKNFTTRPQWAYLLSQDRIHPFMVPAYNILK